MSNLHRSAAFALLALSSVATHAGQEGFYLGGGLVSTVDEDCVSCDTSGVSFELGYDFNRIVGVEAKLAATDYENYNAELGIAYVGLNIGSDFGTEWLRIYGKLGVTSITESEPGYADITDSNGVYGIGVRMTPAGNRKGFYVKLESMATTFFGSTVGAGVLGAGYKF